MKKVLVLFLLVLLCACQTVTDISATIEETIDLLASTETIKSTNNDKGYYAYYVPPSVSNLVSEDTYNIFSVSGNKVLLNLDVAAIISSEYYTDTFSVYDLYSIDDVVYERTDEMLDIAYSLSVYDYGDDYYLIDLNINDVYLIALIYINYIPEVLYNMFVIGLSVEVDCDLVINDFSSLDIVDYHEEAVDLFEIIVPQEGRVEELIKWLCLW